MRTQRARAGRVPVITVAALLAIGAGALLPASASAAATICPDEGFSDTTLHGGVVVSGGVYCMLDHVTVDGSVVVRAGSDVDLEDSRVTGGVWVESDGEVEVGVSLFGGKETHSSIGGGLHIDHALDWDIETATITGGVSIVGDVRFEPTFCGNTVLGSIRVSSSTPEEMWIGDPEEGLINGLPCDGNRIVGSLTLVDSHGFEVESNVVSGSVRLVGSDLELNGNRIGGSLLCSGGTVVEPPGTGDPSGNTVRGRDTC